MGEGANPPCGRRVPGRGNAKGLAPPRAVAAAGRLRETDSNLGGTDPEPDARGQERTKAGAAASLEPWLDSRTVQSDIANEGFEAGAGTRHSIAEQDRETLGPRVAQGHRLRGQHLPQRHRRPPLTECAGVPIGVEAAAPAERVGHMQEMATTLAVR